MIRVASIVTGGAPYLVIAEAALAQYRGAADPQLYDSVSMTAGAVRGVVTSVLGFDAIVLGTPDPLATFSDASGVILARMRYFECDSQEVFDWQMRAVPENRWAPCVGGYIQVTSNWFVFDCAADGESAKAEGFKLTLSPGTYEVLTSSYEPDDASAYDLVRLRRAAV
jgi:hypothetical protein